LSDYLRAEGLRSALVGKTHFGANPTDIDRLHLSTGGQPGAYVLQCGFEPYERDDGLHPMGSFDPNLRYNRYLREQGYEAENPWNDFANSAMDENGELVSGLYMRNAHLPARVLAEHSETAYMTARAIDFVREAGDNPWSLHLSYIKPHWPYMAPAPYHDLYGPEDVLPAVRSNQEKDSPHPVVAAFMNHGESLVLSSQSAREHVIPTYMGLIKEIDDQIGRLIGVLSELGRIDDTLIVVTSDHGDYLGDHWLGEKELFHEPSVRIPLIVVDPSAAADETRGLESLALVEGIDLIPTFIEALAGDPGKPWLEGCSFLGVLRNGKYRPRDYAVSEINFFARKARLELGLPADKAKAWMVRTERWKYIFHESFDPQLFDLENDPEELIDKAADPGCSSVLTEHRERLFEWFRERKSTVTVDYEYLENRHQFATRGGFIFGEW
jgi:arylsulfatase A-like enzyme